ncbi:APC family permease [Paenibacillus eucommiae]|uniref:APA family basic amino acid/polyamine antiporter n=1 Tax=Paenibacillus eucommiae TaxID=1355755 RepID=A0ABS4ILG9_9BACL|nr:amino acid permease [Paenibacillus eucommiae]MBP1988412.1 APA family basic amino acid/polyamine antiporter [Paenibacillus eucommiae]
MNINRKTLAKENKLGVLTLSGLIIGPILGSGILMLPNTVYQIAGDWAIAAWIIIIGVSLVAAYIFGAISIQYPGDGGITNAICMAFGEHIKVLASLFLILGVSVGAVAVLMTASEYMAQVGIGSSIFICYSFTVACILLLFCKITFIGKLSFLMSTVSAITLFVAAVVSLSIHPKPFAITTPFQVNHIGYAVLLLFWAVFGWDIIGNYTKEVKDVKKTTTRAIILSFIVIAVVYMVVAAAVQWTDIKSYWNKDFSLAAIMHPLFGEWSHLIIAFLGIFLCASTYLLYVGGISRLTASLSEDQILPAFMSKRTRQNIPFVAISTIGIVNLIVIFLIQLGWFDLESLVLIANSFLAMNALIGILAGIKVLNNRLVNVSGVILSVFVLVVIMMYSSTNVLLMIGALSIYFSYKQLKTCIKP